MVLKSQKVVLLRMTFIIGVGWENQFLTLPLTDVRLHLPYMPLPNPRCTVPMFGGCAFGQVVQVSIPTTMVCWPSGMNDLGADLVVEIISERFFAELV